MGKTKEVRFAIREYSQLGCNVMALPDAKKRRKITDNLAEEIRHDLNMSYNFGGVNYHISQAAGIIVHVNKLEIMDLRKKEILAVGKMPMFEVV